MSAVSACHYRAYGSQDSDWREWDLKGYYTAILWGKASENRKPKALYKNQITLSGLDDIIPIYQGTPCTWVVTPVKGLFFWDLQVLALKQPHMCLKKASTALGKTGFALTDKSNLPIHCSRHFSGTIRDCMAVSHLWSAGSERFSLTGSHGSQGIRLQPAFVFRKPRAYLSPVSAFFFFLF